MTTLPYQRQRINSTISTIDLLDSMIGYCRERAAVYGDLAHGYHVQADALTLERSRLWDDVGGALAEAERVLQ